ncbi:MAG: hypothetical protein LBQ19_02595 [Synergistaceae bacterium]|jgi:nickel transport protein|nr:hypothetical protein [Synergistaceae bacterium]
MGEKDRRSVATGQCRRVRAAGMRYCLLQAVLVAVLLLAVPGDAFAHGVGYRLSSKKAVALEFYYSTGETMAYLDARAYSPQDERNAFQSGRTDEFGRYSFVPATEGEWLVVVKDEEGHRAEAKVPITAEFLDDSGGEVSVAARSSLPRGFDLFLRAVLGVSILFNLAALVRLRKCI